MENYDCGYLKLERVGKGSFDILGDGWVDIVVFALGAGLISAVAGVVVILASGAGLQLSASGDLHFFDDGLSGLELWHNSVSIIYSGTIRALNPIGPRLISSSKR